MDITTTLEIDGITFDDVEADYLTALNYHLRGDAFNELQKKYFRLKDELNKETDRIVGITVGESIDGMMTTHRD